MNMARREILGESVSPLRVYFMPVALHSYAIFRGAKPIFKWASAKPWDELQLKAFVFSAGMTPFQWARKAFASVAWALVLLKVTAHIIKTYWRLNRLHNSKLREQFDQDR
ncbi:unnamed protein product [Discosporangium mesarthrocarpum]